MVREFHGKVIFVYNIFERDTDLSYESVLRVDMVINYLLQPLRRVKFRFEVWAMLVRLRLMLPRLLVMFGLECCRLMLAIVRALFRLANCARINFCCPFNDLFAGQIGHIRTMYCAVLCNGAPVLSSFRHVVNGEGICLGGELTASSSLRTRQTIHTHVHT